MGWSLGFGRVIGLGTAGAMLVEADGTRHGFGGTVTTYPAGNISFNGHTIDGTFIDYSSFTDSTGTITSAQAKLPNGTIITYGAPGRGAVFPLRITDPNGNFISIQYKTTNGLPSGPKLSFVTDTLGRTVNFYYDGSKLTAITAPGIDGLERQLVRFHYKTLTLNYAFSATLTPQVGDPAPRVLDAIYYPGTGTGYWFGDADSYSPYGMLAKYSEQRGMTFSSPGLNVEGTVTAGTITKQCAYNYPMAPDNTLTNAPTYSTMTETWDGADTGSAITTYLLQKNATTRFATITFPDLTKSIQYSYKAPNLYNDGYIFQDETYDSAGMLKRKSTVTWAMGDYSSARPVRIEAFDELNQKTAAEFDYAPAPAYNSVTDVRDFDYGGTSRLRTTRVLYRNSVEYTGRHIFNLVKRVDVWDATDTIRMSRILYEHDGVALANAPNVVQHDPAYDPNTPPVCHWEDDPNDPDCWGGCFGNLPGCDGICDQIWVCSGGHDPATDYRGNVTSVTRYAAASSAPEAEGPAAVDVGGGITETRTYDITGNVVTASTSRCEQTSLAYSFEYAVRLRGIADARVGRSELTRENYHKRDLQLQHGADALWDGCERASIRDHLFHTVAPPADADSGHPRLHELQL